MTASWPSACSSTARTSSREPQPFSRAALLRSLAVNRCRCIASVTCSPSRYSTVGSTSTNRATSRDLRRAVASTHCSATRTAKVTRASSTPTSGAVSRWR